MYNIHYYFIYITQKTLESYISEFYFTYLPNNTL